MKGVMIWALSQQPARRNCSTGEVAFEYKALWLQAGFYFLTTCWVYRWQILMSRKHAIERYKELKEKENLSKQINN